MYLKTASLWQSAILLLLLLFFPLSTFSFVIGFFFFVCLFWLGLVAFFFFTLRQPFSPTAERCPNSRPPTAARAALLEPAPFPRRGRTHSQDGGGELMPAWALSPPQERGSTGIRRSVARKGNTQLSARLPVPLLTRTTGAARLPPSPRGGRGSGTRRPGPTHSAPTAARCPLSLQPVARRWGGMGRCGGPALTFHPQLLYVGL